MPTYSNRISSLNPKIWLRFDDVTGTYPTNSGSLSTTVSGGGVTLNQSTVIDGKSVYFNGSSSSLKLSAWTSGAVFNDRIFTVETWFKYATPFQGTLYQFSGTNPVGNRLRIDLMPSTDANANKLKLDFFGLGESSGDRTTYSTNTYNDGNWHHVVVTADGSLLKWYIDGSLFTSKTITTGTLDWDNYTYGNEYQRLIGTSRSNVSDSLSSVKFKGYQDEFALYDYALTATQVLDNYNIGIGAFIDATPMTAVSEMPKVLAVHDVLYNLAVQDGAVYGIKLNSNLADIYSAENHTFTYNLTGGTYLAGQTPSITGGAWQFGSASSGSRDLNWTESATPSFDNVKGMTFEMVFKLDAQVTNSNAKVLFNKGWTGGSVAAFLNTSSGSNNTLGFQINYTDYHMFNAVDLVPGNWYHIICEWGAKDNKLTAYINGTKYQSASSYSGNQNNWNDNNQFNIGCENISMDFIAIYATEYNANSYLTDDDVTIHYTAFENGLNDMNNSINFIDPMNASALMPSTTQSFGFGAEPFAVTASAEMVNPFAIVITMNQSEPMLASAEFKLPEGLGDVNRYPTVWTANATMVDPTILAVDNELYLPQPMAASANFETVFWSHDSGLDSSNMQAAAELIDPVIDIAGRVRANSMVATNANIPIPTWETFENFRFESQVLTATAFSPTPPAYILLTDDDWFNRLYAIHSLKRIQPVQTYGTGTNLPNQTTKEYAKGALLFFNDVSSIVRPNTSDKITNTLPKYLFEDIQYDTNGDPIVGDTTKSFYYGKNTQGSISPNPGVFPGSFDPFGRKAVQFQNIEFNLGDELPGAYRPNYSLELMFKSTKSNQIITYGKWASQLYYQRSIGTIGLFEGKIYGMESYQAIGKADVWPHPANIDALKKMGINSSQYFLGNKRIDDGQWHHILIQTGWSDQRMQVWIDGKLDAQLLAGASGSGIPGRNQVMTLRPYILGHNSTDINLYSDFETSGYSWQPAAFLLERDINLNYNAAVYNKPIKVAPMLASNATMVQAKGKGNRPRALMLYFWDVPENVFARSKQYDTQMPGQLDSPTFDNILYTTDDPKRPPQKYYGWDIFPLGVLKPGQSDLIKPEVLQLAHTGYYRNTIYDTPRYLDVVNDIDLTQFDAIFFRNFPDQTKELDSFARNEVADSWANTIEKTLYEDFLKSLRAALDTGISLYVTNHELAQDLGIIRAPEVIPDLTGPMYDEYAKSIIDQLGDNLWENNPDNSGYNDKGFYDTHKNNYYKVLNEFKGITDQPGYVWKEKITWKASSEDSWKGEIGRNWEAFEWKDQLVPGDVYLMNYWGGNGYSPWRGYSQWDYYAVHKDNVLAGTPILGFADTYRRGTELTANPYKDYVTAIAIEPGTMLGGKPIASRIFVNFTERITGSREEGTVDLVSDQWINAAYSSGYYTLAQKNAALAASYNLDRQIEAEIAGLNRPNIIAKLNAEKYWSNNGNYLQNFGKKIDLQGFTPDQTGGGAGTVVNNNQAAQQSNTKTVSDINQAGWSGGIWFTWTHSFKYPRMTIKLPSILTRGFKWLSTREEDFGTVNRVPAMYVNAAMPMPTVVADKDRTVYAPALVASAKIVTATGYQVADFQERPVPMTAYGIFSQYSKVIYPTVMTANAAIRTNIKLSAVETDQVVVYLHHVDPVIYLRGEVIK